jgi:hypothetical protein
VLRQRRCCAQPRVSPSRVCGAEERRAHPVPLCPAIMTGAAARAGAIGASKAAEHAFNTDTNRRRETSFMISAISERVVPRKYCTIAAGGRGGGLPCP